MSDIYKELKKIKRPIVLLVTCEDVSENFNRIRILYPNGICEFLQIDSTGEEKEFQYSCFLRGINGRTVLINTIDDMKRYDNFFVKPLRIELVEVL